MIMMRKLLAIMLTVVVLFTMVACGGNKKGNNSISSSGGSSVTQSSSSDDNSSSANSFGSGSTNNSGTGTTNGELYSKIITFTSADLNKTKTTKFVQPKNVIYMIGDGMGLNDIAICNKFSEDKFEFGLLIDHLPNIGTATTHSASNAITDSAAGGTALATGLKTNNGTIGKDTGGADLKNVSELARELGKKIGVITNDNAYGATPAAFLVHDPSRQNTEAISRKIFLMKPDFFVGSDTTGFTNAIKSATITSTVYDSVNWAFTFDEFVPKLQDKNTNNLPFFGIAPLVDNQLAHTTEIALNTLKNNEEGFFLMVENTGADNAGHSNNIANKVSTVAMFDKAIAVAAKFCIENPDTILIITSDHETGGVTLPNKEDYLLSEVTFTTNQHSAADVGVFAMGYGTEYFNGKKVDNTDIALFVMLALRGEQKR